MSNNTQQVAARRALAEREVRRGNFRAAVQAYEEMLREDPENRGLQRRLLNLRELLQPMELNHPKAAVPVSPEVTAIQEAEAAANRGDIFTAISAYEALLEASPDNGLLRERLEELRELAADPVMCGAMPRSRPQEPRPLPARISEDYSGLSDPFPAPDEAVTLTLALPDDPIARLEELLARVRVNRRT